METMMPATVDEIDDPVTGAAYCKERMKKCEMRAQEAEEKGQLELVAKFEGHLFAWTELLQKYLRESYQEGKTSEELTIALKDAKVKKTRYNAKPKSSEGQRSDATGDSRGMGVEPTPRGMGMEEPLRVAKTSLTFSVPPFNYELQPPEWEVNHTSGENVTLSHYTAKQPDSDSG